MKKEELSIIVITEELQRDYDSAIELGYVGTIDEYVDFIKDIESYMND